MELTDQVEATCRWNEDDEGAWHTTCGNAYCFIEGGPAENGHVWCCYCGLKLTWLAYEFEREDDDAEESGDEGDGSTEVESGKIE